MGVIFDGIDLDARCALCGERWGEHSGPYCERGGVNRFTPIPAPAPVARVTTGYAVAWTQGASKCRSSPWRSKQEAEMQLSSYAFSPRENVRVIRLYRRVRPGPAGK